MVQYRDSLLPRFDWKWTMEITSRMKWKLFVNIAKAAVICFCSSLPPLAEEDWNLASVKPVAIWISDTSSINGGKGVIFLNWRWRSNVYPNWRRRRNLQSCYGFPILTWDFTCLMSIQFWQSWIIGFLSRKAQSKVNQSNRVVKEPDYKYWNWMTFRL